jgi:hypothetical protein
MQEIAPGIHHWTARHPNIHIRVSSYYVEPAGLLINPMEPEDGLNFFRGLDPQPQQIALTNRHHYRQSDRFQAAFGCPVLCPKPGLHEFEGGPEVGAFEFGEELAPGVMAIEIGGISPDESALHIEHGEGAIAFADGLVRPPGGAPLGFVPDALMDDPARTKRALVDAYRGLLERDFEHLLLAHGEPIVGGGPAALREFLDRTG